MQFKIVLGSFLLVRYSFIVVALLGLLGKADDCWVKRTIPLTPGAAPFIQYNADCKVLHFGYKSSQLRLYLGDPADSVIHTINVVQQKNKLQNYMVGS